jgi:hypothetical protein
VSKDPAGGPAFPLQSIGPEFAPGHSGMTLRDWFAGQALAGLCALQECAPAFEGETLSETMAALAYMQADAMLAEREKGQA